VEIRCQDIDALRSVNFVMKDGMLFKKEGVMIPESILAQGPDDVGVLAHALVGGGSWL
jgi:hypothetical protein